MLALRWSQLNFSYAAVKRIMIALRMTKIKLLILPFILAFTYLSMATTVYAEIVRIEFQVAAMGGLTDQYKVRKILSGLDGIQKVILADGDNNVALTFDDELSSLFDIKTALASQGYPATQITQF